MPISACQAHLDPASSAINTIGSMNPPAPSIKVTNLSYRFPDGSAGLRNVSLDLPPGSRTLLIGGISPPSPTNRFPLPC